jgi:hypothetical protein
MWIWQRATAEWAIDTAVDIGSGEIAEIDRGKESSSE